MNNQRDRIATGSDHNAPGPTANQARAIEPTKPPGRRDNRDTFPLR